MTFGIIFHWGLYSVPAFHSTMKDGNGAEWYEKRLIETGKWRPLAGYKQTQAFHKTNYGDIEYKDFAKMFKARNFNPDEWMLLCKSAGAEYVILTAKHHDGYCLWDTKTTDYNSYKTGPKKDIVREFAQSAKKYGLKWGVYYSWSEFTKTCTKDYMENFMIPQVKELIAYIPQIWWADGDWVCTTNIARTTISDLVQEMKQKIPGIAINDRLGVKLEINELGDATFRNYKDRTILNSLAFVKIAGGEASPTPPDRVPWESIQTIGHSWGRNKQQTEGDYKTGKELAKMYRETVKLGGQFLLNLGPDSDGSLDCIEVDRLLAFAKKIETLDCSSIAKLIKMVKTSQPAS